MILYREIARYLNIWHKPTLVEKSTSIESVDYVLMIKIATATVMELPIDRDGESAWSLNIHTIT